MEKRLQSLAPPRLSPLMTSNISVSSVHSNMLTISRVLGVCPPLRPCDFLVFISTRAIPRNGCFTLAWLWYRRRDGTVLRQRGGHGHEGSPDACGKSNLNARSLSVTYGPFSILVLRNITSTPSLPLSLLRSHKLPESATR